MGIIYVFIIAVSGFSLSMLFQHLLVGQISLLLSSINFILIFSAYGFLSEGLPGSRNKKSIILIPILVLTFVYNLIKIELLFSYFLMGLMVVFYPQSKRFIGLRSIPYFKTFLIAFCWSYLLISPIFFEYSVSRGMAFTIFLSLFLFYFAFSLIFDIRDRAVDKSKGIKTLSTEFLTKTNIIIVIIALLMSCSLIINSFCIKDYPSLYISFGFGVIAVVCFCFTLSKVSKNQFISHVGESIPIAISLVYFLSELLLFFWI